MADTPGAQAILAPDSALPEIPHKGTLWKVGRPDQDARARLEKLVKKVNIDEVRAMKDVLSPGAYAEVFGEVVRNLAACDTWGRVWLLTVQAHPHLFLWSLLQSHHPDATGEQAQRLLDECPEEVELAYAQVLPLFFQVLLAPLLAKLPPEARPGLEALATRLQRQLTPTPTAAPKS